MGDSLSRPSSSMSYPASPQGSPSDVAAGLTSEPISLPAASDDSTLNLPISDTSSSDGRYHTPPETPARGVSPMPIGEDPPDRVDPLANRLENALRLCSEYQQQLETSRQSEIRALARLVDERELIRQFEDAKCRELEREKDEV
ncbi:hypothetical protein MKZ38_010690 [Zalerion maritima]|uniref:Uncharacterized protein n=1 Tax=Zalerion maritima TaxID=339359 RepID=A0AAD5RSV6_9PEZI|nr:hypothetical protein MKZ38_010690 [Zalerion maritima]